MSDTTSAPSAQDDPAAAGDSGPAPAAPADPAAPPERPGRARGEPSPGLVRMAKDGATIDVHPSCVADHQRLGWSVAG